jgi:nucleotide-binding universal stress UspA family protein
MEEEVKRILVATDGSRAAAAAVATALDYAAETHAQVRFVHSASPLAERLEEDFPRDGPPQAAILTRDAILAEAARSAKERGVECEAALIGSNRSTSDLAATIAGMANGMRASMIVVGTRGRGAIAGGILGSVSHNLLRYSNVPVVIVHAREPAAAG